MPTRNSRSNLSKLQGLKDVRISALKAKAPRNLSCDNLARVDLAKGVLTSQDKIESEHAFKTVADRPQSQRRFQLRDKPPEVAGGSSPWKGPSPSAQPERPSSSSSSVSSLDPAYVHPTHIHNPILEASRNVILPNHEPYRASARSNGFIKGYAANTNQGSVRNYNEDRVAIILNIVKPDNHPATKWPRCQYFAIYDGHGGNGCADFLRDNLHNYVVRQPCFPEDVKKAIFEGFAQADQDFLADAEQEPPPGVELKGENKVKDRSGSCAVVVIFIDNMVYIANVGDSRGIMSMKGGKQVMSLSTDHKPDMEHQRITAGGGKVYQSQTMVQGPTGNQILLGPPRILPGKLSVSRCFGDVQAKREKFGGNPKVLIAEPQIFTVNLEDSGVYDFIFIGCDGIYDKLTNVQITKTIWDSARIMIVPSLARGGSKSATEAQYPGIHKICGESVELVLRASLMRKSIDNVTGVFICLRNFKKHMEALRKKQEKKALFQNSYSGLQLKSVQNSPSQSRNFKRNELAARYASHDGTKKPATRQTFMPPIGNKTLAKLTPNRKSRTVIRAQFISGDGPAPKQPSPPAADSGVFVKDDTFKSTGPILRNQRQVASSHIRKATQSPPARSLGGSSQNKTYNELRSEAEVIFAKITRKNQRPSNLPPPSRTLPSRQNMRPNSTLTPESYALGGQNDVLSKKNLNNVLRKHLQGTSPLDGNQIFRKSVSRPGRPPVVTGCFSSLKPLNDK